MMRVVVSVVVCAYAGLVLASAASAKPLACMERFRVKDFVIGAWWGPDPSEEDYRAYQDAGFNVLMNYRNRANAKYGPDYQNPDLEFELAEKLKLWVMLDTYMKNDTPWGGIAPDPPSEHPTHHPARLAQLKWLLDRYGKSPVLAGILFGDNCGLHDYMAQNARYLLEQRPDLFPWMSTNPSIDEQGAVPMPLLTTQNYPFLYQVNDPEPVKRKAYCDRLEIDRQSANKLNMALWPFLDCSGSVSPSQLRFQENACVAYGSQGIWYFHYNDNVWDPKDEKPGPLYAAAQECNRYLASVGAQVIGRRCAGVYHFPDAETPAGALTPGPDQLVTGMTDALMVGLLVLEERFSAEDPRPDRLMVVDKRTVKAGDPEPAARLVAVEFSEAVRAVQVFGGPSPREQRLGPDRRLTLSLEAGQGVLVGLG
ncbi:MAG: hypothetical protein FJX75_09130 [Armatimonadetes bacterium]|nr:hypothetical protein [Armatimonadota bacterium]